MFVRKFRGPGNELGAAVQLCTLPWLGLVPDEVSSAPRAAVERLAERLQVVPEVLAGYAVRDQTRTDHLREIAHDSRWRAMDETECKQLGEFLFCRAMEHDAPKLLFRLACEYLISVRVIRPGVVNLLERVATARDWARAQTWTRVEHLLDSRRMAELDGLLVVDPLLGMTRLTWLGRGPTQSTAGAVKTELEKLASLRGMDAHTMDLSGLPAERAGPGPEGGPAPVSDPADAGDAVGGRGVGRVAAAVRPGTVREGSRRPGEDDRGPGPARGRPGKTGEDLLDEILDIVLDPDVDDEQVGPVLRERIGLDRMRAARAARKQRLPRDHGHLAMLDASMSYLRQFAPNVLAVVRFAGGSGTRDLLEVITILAGLYVNGARKVPRRCPDRVRAGPVGQLPGHRDRRRRRHRLPGLPALLGAVRADGVAGRPTLR